MTKRQYVDEILRINRSAKPEFLAKFSEEDLAEYFRHLGVAAVPRESLYRRGSRRPATSKSWLPTGPAEKPEPPDEPPARPVKYRQTDPDELADPAEQAEQAELADPVELTELAEQAELVEQAEPVEQADPAELVEQAELTEQAEQADPASDEAVEAPEPQPVGAGAARGRRGNSDGVQETFLF